MTDKEKEEYRGSLEDRIRTIESKFHDMNFLSVSEVLNRLVKLENEVSHNTSLICDELRKSHRRVVSNIMEEIDAKYLSSFGRSEDKVYEAFQDVRDKMAEQREYLSNPPLKLHNRVVELEADMHTLLEKKDKE